MIRINNLSKKYGRFLALDHINCVLEKKNYAVLGPNGSGKTTLFRVMTGILKADEGSVELDSLQKPPLIGYLPQNFGGFKNDTVYEQMEYFVCLKGLKRSMTDWKEEIMRVLALTNLTDQREKKCGALSGGMVRRLGIAQALLGNPQLIILDEPSVGLDMEEQMKLKELLKKIQGDQTVLFSTHVAGDLEGTAQEIIILQKGKIRFAGSIEQLTEVNICGGK